MNKVNITTKVKQGDIVVIDHDIQSAFIIATVGYSPSTPGQYCAVSLHTGNRWTTGPVATVEDAIAGMKIEQVIRNGQITIKDVDNDN